MDTGDAVARRKRGGKGWPGRRLLLWGLVVYGVVVATGIVAVALADKPAAWTPYLGTGEAPTPDDRGRVNWAAYTAGGRVRVSGWSGARGHHPLFAIDAEEAPTELEKWATDWGDPFPWLELSLDGAHDIKEVVLRHAGWREPAEFTNDRYLIQCLRGDRVISEVGILYNADAVATHPMACPRVDRIRLHYDCTGPADVARLYEIEAWGRP